MASYCFDRRGEGAELLAQRPNDRLNFVRTRERCAPNLHKHLVARHHAAARTDQRQHHLVFQRRGRLASALQDKLTIGLIELAVICRGDWEWDRDLLLASKEGMHGVDDGDAVVDPWRVRGALQGHEARLRQSCSKAPTCLEWH